MAFFETPAEVGRRLDALNNAWNSLRNDVWGRGTTPRAGVPAVLANTIAIRWEQWRAWYDDTRDSAWSAVTGDYVEQLSAYQRTYDMLYAEVVAARVNLPTAPAPAELPQPPAMRVDAPDEAVRVELAPGARWIGWAVGMVAVGAAALAFLSLRRRTRSH